MPKINLLQQSGAESPVSKGSSISNQNIQLFAMIGVVVLGLVIVLSYLWYTTTKESDRVKDELANEQKQAQELASLKEQADELQRKIGLVENRIKVIKQLRAQQRGPVAVLSRINERVPIGINLDSITQRGNLMTIIGNTATEGLVTSFAKDLEFSGGLFTGFDLQTQQQPGTETTEAITRFTIRCTYNPPVATQNPDTSQTASN
jgi:type IV pilus assembly protein PilN